MKGFDIDKKIEALNKEIGNNIWTEIKDQYGNAPDITENQFDEIVKNVLIILGTIKK